MAKRSARKSSRSLSLFRALSTEGSRMRRRVQISFLSVFLTLLTVAFATAVMVRVRSYSGTTATESAAPSSMTARTASKASSPNAPRTTFEPLPADSTVSPSASPAPAATTSSPAATTRAQRFRELLAAGISAIAASAAPAAAPQLTPQPKPVPGPLPGKPVAPPRQPVGSHPQSSMAGAGVGGGTGQPGSSTESKPKTPTNDPKDPNSDTTPPQLLSINFDPPQVQDGGDTMLIVTATDDLSGIRGISGTLTSPNGKAVQGFAQQRGGETMLYTSRIHIPEKAEEGFWKSSFLTMSDMATNSITLNSAQGTLPPTAVLKVSSSASDSTPPSLHNVWLDRRAMRAGEHNTLFVDAMDEKSGIHLVAAVFLSP